MRLLYFIPLFFSAALFGGPVPFGFWKTAAVSGGTAYRYYRVSQVNGGGAYSLGISDIEFFAATTAPAFLTSNGTDLTNGLGANYISSSNVDGSNTGANVFNDNNASGDWYNGSSTECWVGIDLGTAQIARSMNIAVAYAPHSQDLLIQGSNDNVTYTTLATISTPTATTFTRSW